jgi:hypothetical protein
VQLGISFSVAKGIILQNTSRPSAEGNGNGLRLLNRIAVLVVTVDSRSGANLTLTRLSNVMA